jgi:proliferating cell nuclear antigen PCNA
MILTIENRNKLEKFVYLFQLLKLWDSHLNLYFKQDGLFIQAMDKSHVCLANIHIHFSWFSTYFINEVECKLSVSSIHFSIMMNYSLKHNKLEIKYDIDTEPDKLIINLLNIDNKNNFEHLFELPLIDVEQDILDIPEVEYDIEFTINSSKMNEVINDLNIFGSDLTISCDEDNLNLYSSGDNGKLNIPINVNNLEEYIISEGLNVIMLYGLNHIKMCLSTKLKDTMNISISVEYPMRIKYEFGELSNILFFIAPKIFES